MGQRDDRRRIVRERLAQHKHDEWKRFGGAAPIATTGRTKTMIVPKAGETSAAKHGMAAATGRTAAGTGLGNETNGKWSASR